MEPRRFSDRAAGFGSSAQASPLSTGGRQRGALRKHPALLFFGLLLPVVEAAKRAQGAVVCADVWDNMLNMSAKTDLRTCGDMIRSAPEFTRVDQLNAATTISAASECNVCGMPVSAQKIIEPNYPKVQCLADCLPGGASYGRTFCQTETYRAQTARRYTAAAQKTHAADKLLSPSYLEVAELAVENSTPQQSCLAPGDDYGAFLRQAVARGPTPKPVAAWPEREALGDVKVVVNAAANRDPAPLRMLLQSLAAVNFTAWERVVIVQGGAAINAPPRLTRLQKVAELPFTLEFNTSCVVIETTLMNFDLHGCANRPPSTRQSQRVPRLTYPSFLTQAGDAGALLQPPTRACPRLLVHA